MLGSTKLHDSILHGLDPLFSNLPPRLLSALEGCPLPGSYERPDLLPAAVRVWHRR